MKRRGFTLIEMMVVVMVLVTLMMIMFRLSNAGDEEAARALTVEKMQKIENCLSGYYAAFGSYPPVKLHGSRSIFYRTSLQGIQTDQYNENIWGNEVVAWKQVEAACRSQPVSIEYPFSTDYSAKIKAYSDTMRELAEKNPEKVIASVGEEKYLQYVGSYTDGSDSLGRDGGDTDWRKVHRFKFGLLSYLIPRYVVMLRAGDNYYNGNCPQWDANNRLPCDPVTGRQYASWSQMKDFLDNDAERRAHIENIPSQAICARWLPNLAGICMSEDRLEVFGIELAPADPEGTDIDMSSNSSEESIRTGSGTWTYMIRENGFNIYTGAGGLNSIQDQYILAGVKILDGWKNDFYYYSPEPHQSYTLWSAGKDGKTFPPWISRDTLPTDAKPIVASWVADDITHMSN